MGYFRNIALVIFMLLVFSTAYAGDDYKCKIIRLSLAEGDSGNIYNMYIKNYIGKEFTVERNSGLMSGALKNSYVTKPQVIDRGSKLNNSYKVVTTMKVEEGAGVGSNIYALNILEYVESPNKPFVFMENEVVYFGSCVHF
ncbi:MAG: hypothetical protein M1610_05670 [Nitrospirae bacterium]|nr:hypothetical protein [Nitrospirota bacterium]MDA8215264.1 hypothetical protein [Nitrospiraceae bacterium]